MKALKKAAAAFLALCLMVPMFSLNVFAANARLMFTDPSTKVGENVSIDLVVRSEGDTLGDVSVTMNYDTGSIEFVSGDGFEADGSGTLTYTGTGGGTEIRSTVEFRALKTGETKITVSQSSVTGASGDALNLTEGSSTINISAADDGTTSVEPTAAPAEETVGAATDIVVTVNGTDYNFSEAFTTTDIPVGYYEATQTFNGEERKFVANDAGVYLGYLVDSEGAGAFFLFESEDATFVPYMELSISDVTSIIPLPEPEGMTMPEGYQKVDLDLGLEQEYYTWANPETSRYYLIYALNTRTGEKGLYQYDTEDGTYQSYTLPEENETESADSILPGSLGKFIEEHVLVVLIAAAAVILLLLILMIIFAVKLVHRNQELDDLYDEYDIPFEDDEPEERKKSKKQTSLKDEEDEFDDYVDEDEFDDYGDDEFDGYDEEDDYADEDYDDGYEDEDYEEEPAASEQTKNIKRSRKGRNKSQDEDDYEIDFIDL